MRKAQPGVLTRARKSQPMEVKLKVFLNMGEEHIEHLKLIWSTDDKKRRSFLKREYLSAGSISGTFYTRDKNVPLKEKLKHYNGIIALDFDDVQDVEACKQKIALDDYDDWRTIAMSLSNLGEAGYEILDKVSQFSKNYDEADNRKKFDEFLKSTRSIGLGSFFFKCQEYGVIPTNVPHYEMIPFPVEVFPETVRKIIRETNKCLNFSVDHIASSLLFTASVAVGNSVIVEIKNEWVDKAILYIAIVGKLGTNKSAPLRYS